MAKSTRCFLAVSALAFGWTLSACGGSPASKASGDAGRDAHAEAGTDAGAGMDGSVVSCGSLQFSTQATCQTCAESSCCAELAACDTGTPCGDLLDCVGACGSDMNCQKACIAAHSSGAIDAQALVSCTRNSCPTECVTSICTSGATTHQPACDTCLGGACCSEYSACANDAACRACLTGTGSSCDTNPLFMATKTCNATNCSSSCAQGICDSGLTSKVPACDACLTTNACTQVKSCWADMTCMACANDASGAGCSASAVFQSYTTASAPCDAVCN